MGHLRWRFCFPVWHLCLYRYSPGKFPKRRPKKMNPNEIGLLLVIIQTAIASPSLLALVQGIMGRRKQNAESSKDEASSASLMVETATKLANDLGERLTRTNIRVAELETLILSLQSERDTLRKQVIERDQHIAQLEAKVDLLIKLYGKDPFIGV